MVNKKCLFVMSGFLVLCSGVMIYAINSKKQNLNQDVEGAHQSVERSLFKNVYFYKAYEFKPSFILESKRLEIEGDRKFTFELPKGMFYSKDKQYRYEAENGIMFQDDKYFKLTGDVRLSGEETDYASDKIEYFGKRDLLMAEGRVATQYVDKKTLDLLKLKSQKLTSYIGKKEVYLQGQVKGDLKRKRIYEEGMRFSAEKVTLKSLKSLLELQDNVKIYKNNYYLRSGNAEIFLENYNKKLKYYTLYDDVKLEEKLKLSSGATQMRKAFAEKMEGVRSTGQIILTGAPRVEQGSDVIKGYQITLRENTELIEVDDAQSRLSVKKDKK